MDRRTLLRRSLVGGAGLAIVALIGSVVLPTLVLIALFSLGGLLYGMIMPSRDMLVRAVTPPGSMGKVFGFVSTGLSFGGAITPLLLNPARLPCELRPTTGTITPIRKYATPTQSSALSGLASSICP